MKEKLSETQLRVLEAVQEGFPITKTPYRDMAGQVEVSTAEFLQVLRDWQSEGIVRRVGAVVNHFKVGVSAGGMVVWEVEPERVEQVGKILAGFKQVSHAYERAVTETWPYNIYTMVHGASEEEVEETVRQMSTRVGVSKYRILATERELKKVPPTYIVDSDHNQRTE